MKLLWLSLLSGCTCPPLSEVPIRGGSDAEVAIVRAQLQRMERELVLPVCIDHVKIGTVRNDTNGHYNSTTHGIKVQKDLIDVWEEGFERLVRHEVCHSVHVQHDLLKGNESLFPYPDPPDVRDGRLASESFADTCEGGKEALEALWDTSCPESDDLAGPRLIRRRVYGVRDDPPAAAVFEPVASIALADVPDIDPTWEPMSCSLTPTEDPAMLSASVLFGATGPVVEFEVDAYSGEIASRWNRLVTGSHPAPPAVPEGWSDQGGVWGQSLWGGTLGDGTVIAYAKQDFPTGASPWRFHALTDAGWAPAVGLCPQMATAFFAYESALWTVQCHDGLMSWGRWRTEAP